MNHPFPFPLEFPNSGNEEVNVTQRTFKNSRIIVATTERLVEFQDISGTKNYRLLSMASVDCGCHAALNDLFMCELCIYRIVCFMHAADEALEQILKKTEEMEKRIEEILSKGKKPSNVRYGSGQ